MTAAVLGVAPREARGRPLTLYIFKHLTGTLQSHPTGNQSLCRTGQGNAVDGQGRAVTGREGVQYGQPINSGNLRRAKQMPCQRAKSKSKLLLWRIVSASLLD